MAWLHFSYSDYAAAPLGVASNAEMKMRRISSILICTLEEEIPWLVTNRHVHVVQLTIVLIQQHESHQAGERLRAEA